MPEMKFREAVSSLRSEVAGVKAIILIGLDGEVLDYFVADPAFDIGTFVAEYTTLLRIASRTSEDTGSGELREHISVSERTIAFARAIPSGSYLVLISDAGALVGRVRYELRMAAKVLAGVPAKNR
jgi:predicted regulator of Ras-like GTPase activity (Roadblock/LC7/MglB family)